MVDLVWIENDKPLLGVAAENQESDAICDAVKEMLGKSGLSADEMEKLAEQAAAWCAVAPLGSEYPDLKNYGIEISTYEPSANLLNEPLPVEKSQNKESVRKRLLDIQSNNPEPHNSSDRNFILE